MQEIKKELVQALLAQRIIPTKETIAALEQLRESELQILRSYEGTKVKGSQSFLNYWLSRYRALSSVLQARQELRGAVSISRLFSRQRAACIGIVRSKSILKSGNVLLEVEDPTGAVRVITKEKAVNVDEVAGFVGEYRQKTFFASSVIFPDIPLTQELKSGKGAIAVLSDLHIGSKLFLEKEFRRFLAWLRGDFEHDGCPGLASKITTVVIAGDIVDGIGVYPKQESELAIADLGEQYSEAARLLDKIPKRIAIVIIPGNHDTATELSEPQPALKAFLKQQNVIYLSNPAWFRLGQHIVLCYHGSSFDWYGELDCIKQSGKCISDRTEEVIKYLLQRRHLSPAVSASPKLPADQDALVIDQIPDIFISGHVHKAHISSYKGILLLGGSCWQSKTEFQERVGHEPIPCAVPIYDLSSAKSYLLDFKNA